MTSFFDKWLAFPDVRLVLVCLYSVPSRIRSSLWIEMTIMRTELTISINNNTPKSMKRRSLSKGHGHKSILSHIRRPRPIHKSQVEEEKEKSFSKIYRKFYVSHGTVHTKSSFMNDVFYVALFLLLEAQRLVCWKQFDPHFDSFRLRSTCSSIRKRAGGRGADVSMCAENPFPAQLVSFSM